MTVGRLNPCTAAHGTPWKLDGYGLCGRCLALAGFDLGLVLTGPGE